MPKDPICGMRVENEKFTFDIGGRKYFFCSEGCLKQFKNLSEDSSGKYVYDLVIIGGGPAGLTAAIYASVLKINTFLITKDIGGQAVDSAKIKNYMGFDFISGEELVKKFEHQFLQKHYLEHKIDEVVKINRVGTIFEVVTKEGNRITAFTLIIATGIRQKMLGIPGEERHLHRGVSCYPIQDAAMFKDMEVVVIGAGDSGIAAAFELRNSGCKVTLVSRDSLTVKSDELIELKKGGMVCILEKYDVIEIKGIDRVDSVIVQSLDQKITKEIPCKGVFILIGCRPNTEFLQDLVELNEKREIIINPDCSTNVEGIFACGDVTNGFGKRIIIAAGEGAKACLGVKKYLLELGIK